MNLLLLDTAGPVVGLAAFAGERVVHAASARVAQGTEAWLGGEIERALVALGSLHRVAVTVGPGAFTGVRVGVAAALGVAYARRVDVAPLSSLALRATLAPGERRVLALLDARKGRLYGGWFDTRGALPVALDAERDALLAELVEVEPGLAVGEGAVVFAEGVRAAGHLVAANAAESPVALGAALAWGANARSPEKVGLRYLREPDARPRAV